MNLDEVMILESWNIEDGKLKLTGISLLPWLNNRFIRYTSHEDDTGILTEVQPDGYMGYCLLHVLVGSPYLNGSILMGISNPENLQFQGLDLRDYDISGDTVNVGVPYGPVYDAMKEIATTYEIGMQITLESATDTSYSLDFEVIKDLIVQVLKM